MNLVTLILACSLYADNSIPYAMIQTGTKNNPLLVTTDHQSKSFTKEQQALQYTQRQMAQGKTVNIGLMQIPSQRLADVAAHTSDLFRPCKNLVIATQILEKLRLQCQTLAKQDAHIDIQACTLSLYATGNPYTGLAYAHQVIGYAKTHPFSTLAEKARDPGMIAATEKSNPKPLSTTQTILTAHAKQPALRPS